MTKPTAFEQATLELINRARADPTGEAGRILDGAGPEVQNAIRFFKVDTNLFQQQMATFSPSAPLAWSDALSRAAEKHSERMAQANQQSHQLPGEPGLGDRIKAEGYQFSAGAENVYAFTKSVEHGHAGFVIDWGSGPGGMQTPAGHRNAILNERFAEVGVGVVDENDPGTRVGPHLVTHNFGNTRDYEAQLVGVTFRDGDGDRFYDAGEGLGGVTITAVGTGGTFTTTSWDAGGYQMVVPAGSYTVTFSGGGLSGDVTKSAVMASSNVKVDAMAGEASTAVIPGQGTAGNDAFASAAADETFDGKAGIDTLTLNATRASATVTGDDDKATVVTASGGTDTLTSVERLQFTDGTLALDIGLDENAGTAFRVYQAAFNRAPDNDGLEFWMGAVDKGLSFKDMATKVSDATEFKALYDGTTNAAYAAALYTNVLGRPGDAAGSKFWTDVLNAGTADRADVLLGFTRSSENLSITAGATQDGIFIV